MFIIEKIVNDMFRPKCAVLRHYRKIKILRITALSSRQGLTILVSMVSGAQEVQSYPVPTGTSEIPVSRGHKYRDLLIQVGGWARD
jgi:hypothetical protein